MLKTYDSLADISLGDRVLLEDNAPGTVVFSTVIGAYSAGFPEKDWSSMGPGVMIEMDNRALVFVEAVVSDGGYTIIRPMPEAG
ncbi:MAG: hypothetical protein R3D56_08305 [Paracoccaceae bacterium]